MAGFLTAYFAIYSLMHALVYWRVRDLLPRGTPVLAGAIVFMALMILAPLGTRLFERKGCLGAARAWGLAGYGWLGFLFYCFWGVLLVLVAGTLCRLANLVTGFSLPVFDGPATSIGILVAALAINIYGWFEARAVRVERVTLESAKLPPGVERLRIAQISDVHLGLLAGEKRMARILRSLEGERPDVLVSTGDLIDGKIEKVEAVATLFSKIPTRLGKFAVTGNHEIYAGLRESVAAMGIFGFTLLRGEARKIDNVLNIAGVDDPAAGSDGDEKAILARTRNGLFTLFLKHRPDPGDDTAGLFDLQLSGHAHYGQLFPFRYVTGLFHPLQNGLYNLSNGSALYTSRGSGSWGPPVRVLARPEVAIIDIVRMKRG